MRMARDLGPALVELRRERRKTGVEVIEEAGITKAMLSSYENGHTLPKLPTLDKILDALGCTPSDLVEAMDQVARSSSAGPSPGRPWSFGVEEREVLARAVEAFMAVLDRIVLPALRAPVEQPAPEAEPRD